MKDLKILHIDDLCTGCGACANICPKKCIEVKPNKEGFYYPYYNSNNCIECGLCEKTCHVLSSDQKQICQNNIYIYRTKNDILLEKSTSGGAFTLFADYVLREGGIVYGSRYNSDRELLEVCSTNECSMDALRKSKYIESFTGESYREIKKHLECGHKVLFCGTPCQVSGLMHYLNATRTHIENLITLDFVCHGVPSNKCFTEFKHTQETENNKIINVDFRYKNFHKRIFWHHMTLALVYQDKSVKVVSPYYYYYYYKPFIQNLILRKSCYQCDKVMKSSADFTIGDFWAVIRYRPEIDDNRGLSFIKVNNINKLILLKSLAKDGLFEEMPFEVNKGQFRNRSWEKYLIERNKFFRNVEKNGYITTIKSHYHLNSIKKLYLETFGRIKYFLRKIK